jgi:hypothetical protein
MLKTPENLASPQSFLKVPAFHSNDRRDHKISIQAFTLAAVDPAAGGLLLADEPKFTHH